MPLQQASRVILRLKKFLEGWPDELRATMCGMSWDDKFFEGKPEPRSTIVRHLRVDKVFSGRYGQLVIRNVRLSPESILKLGDARGARHLTMLTISGQHIGPLGMQRLARAKHLESLRHLTANRCKFGPRGFEPLARSPLFGQLESLSLKGNEFNENALDVLATIAKPVPLRSLALDDNSLGRVGAAFLAATPAFSSLTKLSLSECGLGIGGAEELANAMFPALEELDVSKNRLGDAGVVALTSRRHSVQKLDIEDDTIGPEGVQALARSGWPLRSLSLCTNRIDDEATRAFAEAKWPHLTELTLDDNDVTPTGLEALLTSTTMPALAGLSLRTNLLGPTSFAHVGAAARHLRKLQLTHNRLSDKGLSAICAAPWEQLEELELDHNGIHAEGFVQLVGASFFDQLTYLNLAHNALGRDLPSIVWPSKLHYLNLSDNQVGDELIDTLAQSPCRPQTLVLRNCGLTDRSALALADSPVLERVTRLVLDENAIGDEGALALTRALDGREVRVLSLEKNQLGNESVVALAQSESLVAFVEKNPYGDPGRRALERVPPRCCP